MLFFDYNRITYKEYLSSGHWKRTRRRALRAGHHKCRACGTAGSILSALQVHHEVYNLGKEKMSDLTVYCSECHSQKHGVREIANIL